MSIIGNPVWKPPDKIWIVKNGVVDSAFAKNFTGNSSYSSLTNQSGYIQLHSGKNTGSYATCSFTPAINFPVLGYKYLVCQYKSRGYYYNNRCPAFGVANSIAGGSNYTTWVARTMVASSGTNTLSALKTSYLDISSVSGTYRVAFQEAGSGNSSWYGDFYCYNLYLSRTPPT